MENAMSRRQSLGVLMGAPALAVVPASETPAAVSSPVPDVVAVSLPDLFTQYVAMNDKANRRYRYRDQLYSEVIAPEEIRGEDGVLGKTELVVRFKGDDLRRRLEMYGEWHRRRLAVAESEEFERRSQLIQETEDVCDALRHTIVGAPASSVADILVKLQLLMRYANFDRVGDLDLDRAYDSDYLAAFEDEDAVLVSLWADANRLTHADVSRETSW